VWWTSSGVGALVVVVAGGVLVLAGTLICIKPGVVCVSVIGLVIPATAAAARWEDAGNGSWVGDTVVGDTMSSGIGVFWMLRRVAGSSTGVEGVDVLLAGVSS
jgi:hypothetical protein